MRRSDLWLSLTAGAGVFVTGVIAALAIFGACNENVTNGFCAIAYRGSIDTFLGVIPALVVVSSGILLGRLALILATGASLALQTALAVASVVSSS